MTTKPNIINLARQLSELAVLREQCSEEERDNSCDDAIKLEIAIHQYPASSLPEMVIKARVLEAEDNGYIGTYSHSEWPAARLARDIERLAGIKSPPPDEKTTDLLYGFPTSLKLKQAA